MVRQSARPLNFASPRSTFGAQTIRANGIRPGTAVCSTCAMNLDLHPVPLRLMLVDDDHDLVDALCEWIRLSSDWKVVPAYGPADAIEQVGAAPPDAILLDMEMHGANGFDTADRLEIASGGRHSALFALTGNSNLCDAASRDRRFAASMLKPADMEHLLTLLRRVASAH
jgi:CheY-like chemotaxis protein